MPNLQTLLEMADQAASIVRTIQGTYDQIKDTLSTDEQEQLNEKLRSIHAENMALSERLDAALAAAEQK